MNKSKNLIKSINEELKRQKFLTQYSVRGNSFQATGKTLESLKPGIYMLTNNMGGVAFVIYEVKTDELLRFEDSRFEQILEEINDFWKLENDFKDMGFNHKRGILLYGSPGTGKTCVLKLVMEDVIKNGDVIFLAKSPGIVNIAMKEFREVEPDRKVLVVLEDIDEMVAYNERSLLELLDGPEQEDKVLYLATTNYIDRLPPRMLRPGRFDRKLEIGCPPKKGRFAYLNNKLSEKETEENIIELVKDTEGFSFGQLRELLVATYCLKHDRDEVISRLRVNIEPVAENEISEYFENLPIATRIIERELYNTIIED